MRFIEIAVPRNKEYPNLPDAVLINLDGILDVTVRSVSSIDTEDRGFDYALFILHQAREWAFHGTKSDCEQGYKDLRDLLGLDGIGIVGSLVFPSTENPFKT